MHQFYTSIDLPKEFRPILDGVLRRGKVARWTLTIGDQQYFGRIDRNVEIPLLPLGKPYTNRWLQRVSPEYLESVLAGDITLSDIWGTYLLEVIEQRLPPHHLFIYRDSEGVHPECYSINCGYVISGYLYSDMMYIRPDGDIGCRATRKFAV